MLWLLTASTRGLSRVLTIRQCRQGYKVGPLFADSEKIALALFTELCALTPNGSEVSLDTLQANEVAVGVAERAGLSPIFETARMYKGSPPYMQIARIFGVTSLELG